MQAPSRPTSCATNPVHLTFANQLDALPSSPSAFTSESWASARVCPTGLFGRVKLPARAPQAARWSLLLSLVMHVPASPTSLFQIYGAPQLCFHGCWSPPLAKQALGGPGPGPGNADVKTK